MTRTAVRQIKTNSGTFTRHKPPCYANMVRFRPVRYVLLILLSKKPNFTKSKLKDLVLWFVVYGARRDFVVATNFSKNSTFLVSTMG